MIINQAILNRLANQHEPRTKQVSTTRIYREALYNASNKEILDTDIYKPSEQEDTNHTNAMLIVDSGYSYE